MRWLMVLTVRSIQVASVLSASSSRTTSSRPACRSVYAAAWRPAACLHHRYGLLGTITFGQSSSEPPQVSLLVLKLHSDLCKTH